jgi:hypothetical protein
MFCIDFRAVTKGSETLQNMSFGSNGVDHVRSLQKSLETTSFRELVR